MYRLIRDNVERVVSDEHTKNTLLNKGYELIEEAQNTKQYNNELSDLTVDELKDLAKQKGVEGISKMKKDEIIKVLEDSE